MIEDQYTLIEHSPLLFVLLVIYSDRSDRTVVTIRNLMIQVDIL